MKTCKKCGAVTDDAATLCPRCNEPLEADAVQHPTGLSNTADTSADFDAADIEQNKVYALLSYIFILWLVPLLAAPRSEFARYHANQGLVLFIVNTVTFVFFRILGIIPIIRIVTDLIGVLVGLLCLALMILGIVNAANGTAKELPLIGSIKLLK